MWSEEFPGFEQVSTDGSSLGNGKKKATAGVGVYFGPNDPRNYGEPLGPGPQTNQRAELKAILKALHTIPITQNLLIETDSIYAIMCVTESYYKWELKSWKKATGSPFKNLQLIKPSVRQLEQRRAMGSTTYFRWVKGHANNPGNEAADKLAVAGARREYIRRYGEPPKEKEKGPQCTLREAPFGWKVVRHADGTETLEPNPQDAINYKKRDQAAKEREAERIKVFKSKRRRGGSAAQRMAIKTARAAEAAKAAEAADTFLAEMDPDSTSDVAAQTA